MLSPDAFMDLPEHLSSSELRVSALTRGDDAEPPRVAPAACSETECSGRLPQDCVCADPATLREITPLVGPTPLSSDTAQKARRCIFIVLPAYNEAENLARLLERVDHRMHLAGILFRIIVVDDGSSDGTSDIARRFAAVMPVTLLSHDINQGLGRTLADGLVQAILHAHDDDVVVTMDADATHDAACIPEMARHILGGCDVVIASRYVRSACVTRVPVFRRGLSLAASLLFRILFPISGARDYTSGFRAYRGATLKSALAAHRGRLVEESGFDRQAEILLKLRRLKVSCREVPITLHYEQKQGRSKIKIVRTTAATLRSDR